MGLSQQDDYKQTLLNMESVCIFVQEIVSAYAEQDEVIEGFLVEMTKLELDGVKAEIKNFLHHMAEIETSLALDRQEL